MTRQLVDWPALAIVQIIYPHKKMKTIFALAATLSSVISFANAVYIESVAYPGKFVTLDPLYGPGRPCRSIDNQKHQFGTYIQFPESLEISFVCWLFQNDVTEPEKSGICRGRYRQE